VSEAEEVITDRTHEKSSPTPEVPAPEHKASALLGGMDIAVTDEIGRAPMLSIK